MKTKKLLFVLAAASLSFVGAANAASYTYDWIGGTPGYYGSLVLDASSSSSGGGSASDIVSLSVTTPHNGTIVLDTADWVSLGYPQLLDPVFTWNSSQITEMAIFGYDASGNNSVLIAEDAFVGGANQDSNELGISSDADIGTYGVEGGSWEAVPNAAVPEPVTTIPYVFALLVFCAGKLLRERRRSLA